MAAPMGNPDPPSQAWNIISVFGSGWRFATSDCLCCAKSVTVGETLTISQSQRM